MLALRTGVGEYGICVRTAATSTTILVYSVPTSKIRFELSSACNSKKGFDQATHAHWRCSTCLHHVTLKWRLDSIFTRMFDLLVVVLVVVICSLAAQRTCDGSSRKKTMSTGLNIRF